MKQILKNVFTRAGYVITKRQPYHNNYNWLTDHNIQTIMDIGANTGQFAKYISSRLPNSLIYSFEPIPSVYKKLVKNTQHLNIKTFPFALGSKPEETTINVNAFSPSSSLMEMSNLHKTNFDFATTTTTETIKVKCIDDLLNISELKKNILSKIDVQGFEDQVILGGQVLLKNSKVVICEVSFKELYKGQKLFGDIFKMMHDLDFTYMGNYDQVYNYETGGIIGGDAVFINNRTMGS